MRNISLTEDLMYLARLESRFLVESDFKSKIRDAFIPILFTMMGCGVDDSKKDKPTPEETSPTSVSDPYMPSSSSQNNFKKTIEDILEEKGWGCEILLDRPKKTVLIMNFYLVVDDPKVSDKIKFGLVFMRQNTSSPWELTSMSPSSQRSYDEYPPLIKLRQDVKDAAKQGVNYVKNKFDCIFPPGGDEPL